MDVVSAAAELGVSPRRVRALIDAGRVAAHKSGRGWVVTDLGGERRRGRPLSEGSRAMLTAALRARTLRGLAGHDRARTASRIGQLRASSDPAGLLAAWWGGQAPQGAGFGENLVRRAVAGDDGYVREAVRQHHREYLRDRGDLAEVVSSERAIRGWTRSQLAEAAAVPVAVVEDIERARALTGPGGVRRVLRALEVEPTALPDLVTQSSGVAG
jgi:hypothetical protein